jgi:hypothetical protein
MVFGQQSKCLRTSYPFRPINTKNKRMCGVNQKLSCGLSATLNLNKNNYYGSIANANNRNYDWTAHHPIYANTISK